MLFEEQPKITIEDLIKKVKEYNNNNEELEQLRKAHEYADKKHFGVKRITGDDYITHPLNVAMILTDINADVACLTAALLHDTIEDTDSTKEEVTKLFGSEVALLVDGVTKINRLHFSNAGEQMAAPLLLGLGLDEFSMSATSVLAQRKLIRNLSKADMEELANKALNCGTMEEVVALVKEVVE